MNPWTVTAITIGILCAYSLTVRIIGGHLKQAAVTERQLLASITDHPTRNAKQITQVHYAELIVAELAQHGHTVTVIDVLDCLASTRVKFADDIDGAAVDAYYATVLGGDAS